ncbi:hypothetical protein CP360_00810 [Lactobacillus sp. UMNPBX9]|nr:hypothetical protein CP360_00810 [Lactobacillus sp. UMNPBX9]
MLKKACELAKFNVLDGGRIMKEQIISRERLKNINEEWGNLIIRKFNRKLEREAESGKKSIKFTARYLKSFATNDYGYSDDEVKLVTSLLIEELRTNSDLIVTFADDLDKKTKFNPQTILLSVSWRDEPKKINLDESIAIMDLPVRTYQSLQKNGIETIKDLLKSKNRLKNISGIGELGINRIELFLKRYKLNWIEQ